jgi:Putative peptidoglycan binding domain
VARTPSPACARGLGRGREPEVTALSSGSAVSPTPSPSRASGEGQWTWPRACYEGELFNGFGPRAHGRHTGYLWSWTNIYTGGKYVADGKWDPDAQDQQCGMAPMMAALLRLDGALALADAPPSASEEPGVRSRDEGGAGAVLAPRRPIPEAGRSSTSAHASTSAQQPEAPVPPPAAPAAFDADETAWLQAALNRLGAAEPLSKHERLPKDEGLPKQEGLSKYPPLIVDGCYGRHTRRAVATFQAAHGLVPDGLAGPLTVAEIRKQL